MVTESALVLFSALHPLHTHTAQSQDHQQERHIMGSGHYFSLLNPTSPLVPLSDTNGQSSSAIGERLPLGEN